MYYSLGVRDKVSNPDKQQVKLQASYQYIKSNYTNVARFDLCNKIALTERITYSRK
jgi:hypothetical protein